MSTFKRSYLPALKDIVGVLELGGVAEGFVLREESGIYLMADVQELASYQEEQIIRITEFTQAATSDRVINQLWSWTGSDEERDIWFLDAWLTGVDSGDDFAGFAGELVLLQYRQLGPSEGDVLTGMVPGNGIPIMTFDPTTAFRTDFGGTGMDTYVCIGNTVGNVPVRCSPPIGLLEVNYFDGPLGATDVYRVYSRYVKCPKGVKPASVR